MSPKKTFGTGLIPTAVCVFPVARVTLRAAIIALRLSPPHLL
jgi:hypothetical protein